MVKLRVVRRTKCKPFFLLNLKLFASIFLLANVLLVVTSTKQSRGYKMLHVQYEGELFLVRCIIVAPSRDPSAIVDLLHLDCNLGGNGYKSSISKYFYFLFGLP